MKPMTKEEWDARQSIIRRVVDPETGRTRYDPWGKGRQVVHPHPCCVGWSPGGCLSTALQYHAWTQVPFSSKGRSLAGPLPSDPL